MAPKAKKVGKVTNASKKDVSNEKEDKGVEIEMNGSGEPQEEIEAEEQVEIPTDKRRQKTAKTKGKKELTKGGDKEESSNVEIEVKTKDLPAKRGRKAAKAQNGVDSSKEEENLETKTAKTKGKKESTEDGDEGESSKGEIEAKTKDLPTKRGRKAAKVQNVVDSSKDENLETKETKADIKAKDLPRSRRNLKADNEPSNSVKEEVISEPKETKAKTTRKAKVQSKEDSVEKEAPSKGPGRKRKNAIEKNKSETSKKAKDEKTSEVEETRRLHVHLNRSQRLDDMARQLKEDEAEAAEEPKTKSVKGPAKTKGKRAAKDDAEPGPTKKAKENTSKSKNTAKKEKDKIPDVTALDFDNESRTTDGKPWNLKITSWNVNGLRAWLEKNGMSYLHHEKPDIMCIQETKCSDDKLPPEVNVEGYHCYWLAGDKDGYSGVGLLSKEKPISVHYGINMEKHDNEGRVITAEYDEFYLVTTYIPNAGRGLVRLDYRQEWDKDFRSYLKKLDEKKPVVLCGDLNVAHEEIDIANPKSNKKNAGFTKEEREGFSTLLSEGFVDTFRHLYPDQKSAYTFWTYMMNARAKNVGWRLDYFVISKRFTNHLCDSVIRKDVYGSDHCPVALFLHV